MEHRSASPTLAFSVIRKTSGRRTKSTGKKTDRTHHNSYQRFALQFGTRTCHFAWYLLHLGMVTFYSAWYLLHLAMFAFHFAWYFPHFGTSTAHLIVFATSCYFKLKHSCGFLHSVLSFRASFRVSLGLHLGLYLDFMFSISLGFHLDFFSDVI